MALYYSSEFYHSRLSFKTPGGQKYLLTAADRFFYHKTMKTKSVLSVSEGNQDLLRRRILTRSQELFFRHGFNRVSMDELAEDLGISKATIYRYFPDKKSLLREVLKEVREALLSRLEQLRADEKLSSREKLLSFFRFFGQAMSSMDRELLKDIKSGLPDIWQEIESLRREKVFPIFCSIVLEGVKKGEIRSDLDARLFLEIFFFLVQEFINPDWLVRNDYSPSQLLDSIMRILFYGIFLEGKGVQERPEKEKRSGKNRKREA